MKKFLIELINRKWIGVILTVLFSFVVAWISTTTVARYMQAAAPVVSQEAQAFLPITLENGAITEPQNTVIVKEYQLNDSTMKVVLNTEVDELSSDDIKDSGVYFSRKFMYAVSPQKTEIRSLSDMPNMTVDQEMFDTGMKWLEAKVGGYLFATVFIMLLIYIGIAVLIYAGISQLLLGKLTASPFGRTLRITTLGYLVLFIIALISGWLMNILIKLVLLILLNYFTNKQLYPVKK